MIYRYVKISQFSKIIQQLLPRYCNRGIYLCRGKSDFSSVCNGANKPEKCPNESKVSYAFHPETEEIFNQQINIEFKAFYSYLSMAAYFGRADVALPGCESFFTQMHVEEHDHALQCLNYIKMRGGLVNLRRIDPPEDQDWKSPLNAFKVALQLEMDVTDKLVNANTVATKHGDLNASDFVVTNFMNDQMKSVSEMARFVTVLSAIGDQSLARFIFDKDLLENHVLPGFNVLKEERPKHLKNK